MKILENFDLDASKDTVAIIMNAVSSKYGRKDVIKIERMYLILTWCTGYHRPEGQNFIDDHIIREKIHLKVPERVVNIIKCNNSLRHFRWRAAPQIFHLIDKETENTVANTVMRSSAWKVDTVMKLYINNGLIVDPDNKLESLRSDHWGWNYFRNQLIQK